MSSEYYAPKSRSAVELGLDVHGTARNDLETALKGHTLGEARVMGRYERAKR